MYCQPSFSMKKTTHNSVNLLALDWDGAASLVSSLGWPQYRAQQILRWLYQRRVRDIGEMTNLSLSNRTHLQSIAHIPYLQEPIVCTAEDHTQKFLFYLNEGNRIESVVIPESTRLTLCVSTQVGCTLDCTFCLTGQMGLRRNLTTEEIVGQVLAVQDRLKKDEHLTSLVFMGMGEPLANFEAVSDAIRRLTDTTWGVGFPARRITISTAGLISRFPEVCHLGVNLAISLNATTNELRHRLMPTINSLHPLHDLITACRRYPLQPGRKLTFEYVLLAGVNDSVQDANRLPKLLHGIQCKINLIPFNEFPGSSFTRPVDSVIEQFQSKLREAGFDVFVRKSRGKDVLGACGQLGESCVNGGA